MLVQDYTAGPWPPKGRLVLEWTAPSTDDRVVTVIGVGVIGRRIALSWILGGYTVHVYDPSAYQRNATAAFIAHNTSEMNSCGHFQVFSDPTEAVADAWLIIEAVPEELHLKAKTFASVVDVAPHDAILATSSSLFTTRDLVHNKYEPGSERMVNLHYTMAPKTSLVELMASPKTSTKILPFLSDRIRDCGLMPIVARKESDSLVMERIWAAIQRETLDILSEGIATAEEIDTAWSLYFDNAKVGPCARMDTMGLDLVASMQQRRSSQDDVVCREPSEYLDEHYIQEGKLGARSEKGGLYPPGSNKAVVPTKLKVGEDIATPMVYVLDLGTAAENASLSTGRVCLGSPDGRKLQTLVPNQPRPDGINVSVETGRMYWTLMGVPGKADGIVRSCELQGGTTTDIIPQGVTNTPKQIAIDHVHSKLYICDREGMKVWRCDMDGGNLEVIMRAGDHANESHRSDLTRWCVGICVSPSTGKFYWTQKGPSKGNKGRIFRANMDMPEGQNAANRQDIECLFDKLPEPIDLEIDDENQELWWTDRGDYPNGNSLNRASLQQNSLKLQHTVVAKHFHEAIGLKIDWINRHVYVTDIGGAVYMLDMDGKNRKRLYEFDDAAFSGICLVHA